MIHALFIITICSLLGMWLDFIVMMMFHAPRRLIKER